MIYSGGVIPAMLQVDQFIKKSLNFVLEKGTIIIPRLRGIDKE